MWQETPTGNTRQLRAAHWRAGNNCDVTSAGPHLLPLIMCVPVCVLGWGAGCLCVEKGTEDVGHTLPGQKEAARCWKPGPSFMFTPQVIAGRMRS